MCIRVCYVHMHACRYVCVCVSSCLCLPPFVSPPFSFCVDVCLATRPPQTWKGRGEDRGESDGDASTRTHTHGRRVGGVWTLLALWCVVMGERSDCLVSGLWAASKRCPASHIFNRDAHRSPILLYERMSCEGMRHESTTRASVCDLVVWCLSWLFSMCCVAFRIPLIHGRLY